MTRKNQIILLVTTTLCGAVALTAVRAHDAPRVATGFVAHILCSETFVSGLDPDRVFSETMAAMPGTGLITWAIDYKIDRARKDVTVTLLGGGQSHAVFREGLGCYVSHDDAFVDALLPSAASNTQQAWLPEIAGPSLVEPANRELGLALDGAFAESGQPPFRHTKAVVVVKDGRVVAERYAAGYGIETPMLGFSATKSVTSALIGILVRQGKLAVNEPAPIAAWQSPDDPRHAITVDHLLRHTAGLAMGSSLNASLASAFDRVNRMKYVVRDMAGFAENSELESAPGSVWNYHDGNTIILSRLIRDAAGGHAADVLRLARAELFDPLGMRRVTLEFDATGTPEGSSQMLASARDWARFGALYLDDGIIGGKRILPEGWVDLLRCADTERMGGKWRGILDQSRRQSWRQVPHQSGLARRILLCQRHIRTIRHHRAVGTAGHRALRHLRKSIRHRRRFTACCRRDRRDRATDACPRRMG